MRYRVRASGRRRPEPGRMNGLERDYSLYLEQQKAAGRILWFEFEGMKFRLADKTFYTPDFAVMMADGEIQMHEVKGYWEDDARVKIKVAAELFPFRFWGVKRQTKKNGGNWEFEEF